MPFVPERLSERATRRLERAFLLGVFVFVAVGVATPPEVFAQGIDFKNTLLAGIAYVLEWVLNFLGTFVLVLVDGVISVAQYNDFATARPVEAGWPLVRDVVNMFFIVILLITAFSTIIQYKKFEYRKVLPKLLLMAVLVNFSKTFIGLLIDVSQVIMLTFVNGFQAAAAGNFVQVLKLDKVLQLAQAREGDVFANDPFLLRIVMAEFLGVFILGLSLTTLLIMLLYLVFRVIGLWLALIFSPAAFFATALESTPLSKGVAFIAGNFWPRLGALLSGGPIMAFFLWLTLATVQTGGFMDFDSIQGREARQAEQGQALSYFANEVGSAEEVATFLVGVMMLIMGIEAALTIAGQVNATLGNVSQRVRSTGMAATRFAAYGGALMAGSAAGRAGGRLGRAGGRLVDSRWDLTGKVGKGLQRIGSEWVPPALGGAALAAAGGRLRGRRGEERRAALKSIEEQTANMGDGEKIRDLQRRAKETVNKDTEKALQIEAAKTMTSKGGVKDLKDEYTKQGLKEGYAKDSPALDAYADQKTREATAQQFGELRKIAKATGDTDLLKYVDEEEEKRPDRITDPKDFNDHMDKMIGKGASELQKISPDAWQDSRLLDATLTNTDMLRRNRQTGEVEWNKESDFYKKLAKGSRGRLFNQRLADLKAAAGPGATLEAIQAQASKGQRGGEQAHFYARQKNAPPGSTGWRRFAKTDLAQAPKERGRAKRRQEDRIQAASQRAELLRAEIKDLPEAERGFRATDMRMAQYGGMNAGGRVSEIYGSNEKGEFGSDVDRRNFEANTQQFMQEAATDHTKYQSLDLSDMHAQPGVQNDLRSAFVSKADVGNMGKAWNSAAETRDQASLEQIQSAANLIHEEGRRVEDRIAQYNHQHADAPIDMDQVRIAGDGNNAEALKELVGSMPEEEQISLDEARALARKEQLNEHKQLRHALTAPVSGRMQEAYERAVEHRQAQAAESRPPTPSAGSGATPAGAGPAAPDAAPTGDVFRDREADRDDS